MEGNINSIISNSLLVDKTKLNEKSIKNTIEQIKIGLESNKEEFLQVNKIDEKNSNGFILDFAVINNIFKNIQKEELIYGKVLLSQKDDEKKIMYGKQIMDQGLILVITDGNPYVTIEMILRNILAGNTTLLSNNGFMYGTNKLIIKIVQTVLENNDISPYLVQEFVSEDFDVVLSNFANIDLVVCVGNHNLQRLVLNKSKNRTIISGYENFDLYIEDKNNIDLITKIYRTRLNIQFYINSELKIDTENAIIVDNIDEAISQINYNGSKYSAAIFTSSKENTSKFIREVKSKIVTVNTSPTIERIIDIKQSDLCTEKTIIYPLTFSFNEETININLKENNE